METVSPNQGSSEGENPRAALKLEIEGMHCAGCVSSVEKALNGLVGVSTEAGFGPVLERKLSAGTVGSDDS